VGDKCVFGSCLKELGFINRPARITVTDCDIVISEKWIVEGYDGLNPALLKFPDVGVNAILVRGCVLLGILLAHQFPVIDLLG
jgi:hypothetical protein